jgi:tetratricopeptide (TPR) repeat protein
MLDVTLQYFVEDLQLLWQLLSCFQLVLLSLPVLFCIFTVFPSTSQRIKAIVLSLFFVLLVSDSFCLKIFETLKHDCNGTPAERAAAAESLYLFGLTLKRSNAQCPAQYVFNRAIAIYETSGEQLERPGVMRQLWRMYSMTGKNDKAKLLAPKLLAIEPRLLAVSDAEDYRQEYDSYGIDKSLMMPCSGSMTYSRDTEASLLRRLQLHRLYLPKENSLECEYYGSGRGASSPVLNDLLFLARIYKNQNKYDKAAIYFAQGMKVYHSLQPISAREMGWELDVECQQFKREYDEFQTSSASRKI